jgi:hypothetical protein
MIDRNKILEGFVEVIPTSEGDFLRVKETLTRIGISTATGEKKLYQSCHILHKKGKYYIVHFKEMFFLDNGKDDMLSDDKDRRNKIICLLKKWGLISVVSQLDCDSGANPFVKVVPYGEKDQWKLISKYSIGNV